MDLIQSENFLDKILFEKRTEEFDRNIEKKEQEKVQKTKDLMNIFEKCDQMTEE